MWKRIRHYNTHKVNKNLARISVNSAYTTSSETQRYVTCDGSCWPIGITFRFPKDSNCLRDARREFMIPESRIKEIHCSSIPDSPDTIMPMSSNWLFSGESVSMFSSLEGAVNCCCPGVISPGINVCVESGIPCWYVYAAENVPWVAELLNHVLELSEGISETCVEQAVSAFDVGLEDGGKVERYSTKDGWTSGKLPSAGMEEPRKLSDSVIGLGEVEQEAEGEATVLLFFLLPDKRRVTSMRVWPPNKANSSSPWSWRSNRVVFGVGWLPFRYWV